jgi:hypothetical protein
MDRDELEFLRLGFFMATIVWVSFIFAIYNINYHDDSYIFKANKACEKANSTLHKLYDDGDILCKNKASFSRYEVTHILQEDN